MVYQDATFTTDINICAEKSSESVQIMAPTAYIAVHGGAGVHALKHEKEIKRALRKYVSFFSKLKQGVTILDRACTYALSAATTQTETSDADLENIHLSLTMVEYAIKVLEDDEHFNAGYFFLGYSWLIECKVVHALALSLPNVQP